MKTFRILLKGEGKDVSGDWIGFFTTIQIAAKSEVEASTEAVTATLSKLSDDNANSLKEVTLIDAIEIRQVYLPWFKRPRAGYTFFSNDYDAEALAKRIERRAAGLTL